MAGAAGADEPASAELAVGKSPSLFEQEGSTPSSFPDGVLRKEHFLDLCRRLDRIEHLLQGPCSKAGALAGAGDGQTERAWDAGVADRAPLATLASKAVEAEAAAASGGPGDRDSGTQDLSIGADPHPSPLEARCGTSSHNTRMTRASRNRTHHLPRSNQHERSAELVEEQGPHGHLRRAAVRLMQWRGGVYDVVVGVVIFVNAIILGIEIQWNLEGDVPSEMVVVENLFLAVFMVDLTIRMLANQKGYLRSGWFLLELLLVVTGVLQNWILAPIESASAGGYVKNQVIRLLMILRTLRLLRLLRALRMFEVFESLWKLCNGLLLSAKTVSCALLVVFLFTYVFACFAVEVITQSELLRQHEDTKLIVEARFSSLIRSAMTLFSFANADSLASFYEPLIMQNPLLAPFFALVWLVLTVSLMNLVTAVIVEEAIALSSQDVETRRAELKKKVKSLMPQIEKLFDDMDASGDGALEIAELDVGSITIPPALEGILNEDRLRDLFELLDDDGSGTVDKHEFTDGVISLALQNVPIETTQILHLLRVQHNLIEDILKMLDEAPLARNGGPQRGIANQLPFEVSLKRSHTAGVQGMRTSPRREESYTSPIMTPSATVASPSPFPLQFFDGEEGPMAPIADDLIDC